MSRRTVHLAQCYRCRRLFNPRGKNQPYCPECAAELQERYRLSRFKNVPWGPLAIVGVILYFLASRSRDPLSVLLALVAVGAFIVFRYARS